MNPILKAIADALIAQLISYAQNNQAAVVAFFGKEAGYGEADLVAYATKLGGAEVGALVQAVLAVVQPELPKYEGDAVAWVIASLQALQKSLG